MNTETATTDLQSSDVQCTDALPSSTEASLAAARERLKSGRNEPCPCGSSRKYKKCCLRVDEDLVSQAAVSASRALAAVPSGATSVDRIAPPPPKAKVVSETDRKLDELWQAFDSLSPPSAAHMDELLEALLALPPEVTDWNELLNTLAHNHHPDLAAVFHRIAASVPHTTETGMSYFYWAAAEEFSKRGCDTLLREAVAGYMKLDVHCYDAEALMHIQDILLAGRFEAEVLGLTEHFLPVIAADAALLPHAIVETRHLLFQLRAGIALRGEPHLATSPQLVAQALARDLEEDVDRDMIDRVAQLACDATDPEWTRAHFDLVTQDIHKKQQAWQDCLRLNDTLLRVAREAWRVDGVSPGWVFVALSRLLSSVYREQDRREAKPNNKKNRIRNLLGCLTPSGIEPRIVLTCRGPLGVSAERARIAVDAHTVLLEFASRHALITSGDAAATRTELARVRGALGFE